MMGVLTKQGERGLGREKENRKQLMKLLDFQVRKSLYLNLTLMISKKNETVNVIIILKGSLKG